MKERQNTEDAVRRIQHKNLGNLIDVSSDVPVTEYYALRIASTATGKDDGRSVVQFALMIGAASAFKRSSRQKPGSQQGSKLLPTSNRRHQIFQVDRLTRHYQLHLLQKYFRSDHGF